MAYQRGDGRAAASALDLSIALDPSLAIYRRERASLSFAAGQYQQASTTYRQALSINRYDPVAWRGLALTLLGMSDAAASGRAAKAATDLMFLSPQNQMVLAAVVREDRAAFEDAMRVALEQAPQLAATSWDGTILGFADRVAVARRAVATSSADEGPNVAFGRLLLAVLVGSPDAARAATGGVPFVERFSAASLASFVACDSDASVMLIDKASKTEGEFPAFWIARSVISAASGIDHQQIVAMSVRVLRLKDSPQDGVVSALAGDRSDAWRYRRTALGVRTPLAGLPSSGGGLFLLLSDPATAFASLGTSWPPGCL
jgi:tetratricopeptide (TPR) repeat protein